MTITFDGAPKKHGSDGTGAQADAPGPGREAYEQSSLPRVPERTSSIAASVMSAPELSDRSENGSSIGHKERMEYRMQREKILKRMQKNWKPKSIEEQVEKISHSAVEWDEKIRKARLKAKLWKAARWAIIVLAIGAIIATTATLTTIHVNKKNSKETSDTEMSVSSKDAGSMDHQGLSLFSRDNAILGNGAGLRRVRRNVEKLLAGLDKVLEEDDISSVNLVEENNGYSMILDRPTLAQMSATIKEMAEEDLAFLQQQLEETLEELKKVAREADVGNGIQTQALGFFSEGDEPDTHDEGTSQIGKRKLLQHSHRPVYEMNDLFVDTIIVGAGESIFPEGHHLHRCYQEAEERLEALSQQ